MIALSLRGVFRQSLGLSVSALDTAALGENAVFEDVKEETKIKVALMVDRGKDGHATTTYQNAWNRKFQAIGDAAENVVFAEEVAIEPSVRDAGGLSIEC